MPTKDALKRAIDLLTIAFNDESDSMTVEIMANGCIKLEVQMHGMPSGDDATIKIAPNGRVTVSARG